MNKYSIILGNLGNTCDRFLSSGYKYQPEKEVMLKQASEIEGVTGIELVGNWDVTEGNAGEIGNLLDKYNLQCVSIIPDHFGQQRWGRGSFCSKDPGIREAAVMETVKMAEVAKKLNCTLINLWPGQDGFDYPLQGDYMQEREWIRQGIEKVSRAYPDIRFSLEYKMKEPRTHSYLAGAADTLLTAQGVGLENVGVTIDTGHSLLAGENMAHAAVMLQQAGNKLFHLHFNDNYRAWDDDMIVGSIHFVEYVELMYWLKVTGYDGWYSMDQYPYREDGQGAIRESVEFLKGIERLLEDKAMDEIKALIEEGNAVKSVSWFRKRILG